MLSSSAVQAVIGSVASKGVGSVCRMQDYQGAPQPVYRQVVAREGAILASHAVFSTGMQYLLNRKLPDLIKRFPAAGTYETLIRFLLTVPSLFLAEGLGRIIFPAQKWHNGHPVSPGMVTGLSKDSKASTGMFAGVTAFFAGLPSLQRWLGNMPKTSSTKAISLVNASPAVTRAVKNTVGHIVFSSNGKESVMSAPHPSNMNWLA